MSSDAGQRFNGALKRVADLYIQALGIVTSMIDNLAVTTAKLAAASVTRAKLGTGGIVMKYVGDTDIGMSFVVNNFFGLHLASRSVSEIAKQDVTIGSGRVVRAKVNVHTNDRDAAAVITLRVNGIDTGMTITIPALTAGIIDSVGAPVAFADDDLISWGCPASGTVGTASGTGSVEVEYDN